MFPCFWNKKFC